MSCNTLQIGHRVGKWSDAVGLSRTKVRSLINYGKIPYVKIDGCIVITVAPADFLAQYEEIQGWLANYMQTKQAEAVAELAEQV